MDWFLYDRDLRYERINYQMLRNHLHELFLNSLQRKRIAPEKNILFKTENIFKQQNFFLKKLIMQLHNSSVIDTFL